MSLLMPETKAPVRPSLAEVAGSGTPATTSADEAMNLRFRILYLRSYLLMRAIIGFIGVSLPVVLIVGDHLLQPDAPVVRHSLSDYYYSAMRDFFVGGLFSAAVFLVTYKVFERNLNNVLSVVGGLAAFAVALFPTKRPPGVTPLTSLQARLGEVTVSHVHLASAVVFVVSLAIISFFFGLQEGRRSQQRVGRRARMSPTFWRWFHWIAAAAILLAVAFIVVAKRQQLFPTYAMLIAEVVAVVAFGLSWLTKGLELDIVLGTRAARRRWSQGVAPETP